MPYSVGSTIHHDTVSTNAITVIMITMRIAQDGPGGSSSCSSSHSSSACQLSGS